jgi:YidC/Oxa1 family membrane protein insertase
MISSLFHAAFYNPIYNVLVALVAYIPGGDVGVAVILMTLIIQLVLLPFSLSAARAQIAMKILEPKMKELKEKHKGDKDQEALAMLELYRAEKINPFASILTIFVQLPVMLALYLVFRREAFPALNHALLYSFTPIPHTISLQFLGLFDIASKSLIIAALAGLAQYVLALMTPLPSAGSSGQADFSRVLAFQMKYFFPLLIAVIAYTASAAIGIYFLTLNIARALQQWYILRTYGRPPQQL